MDKVNIEGVILTPLNKISHPKGDIFHGIKKTDIGYSGFGEAYFSIIKNNFFVPMQIFMAIEDI